MTLMSNQHFQVVTVSVKGLNTDIHTWFDLLLKKGKSDELSCNSLDVCTEPEYTIW